MKVLTLNTHSWMNENQLEKINILVNKLLKERYDFIALQEVNQSINEKIVETSAFNPLNVGIKADNFALVVVEKLKEKGLNYHWTYLPVHIGYEKYDEGHAILSLKPIEEIKSYPISLTVDYDDYKTRSNLGIKLGNLEVISVHMGWEDDPYDPFIKQWEKFKEQLNPSHDYLIMGDFNIKDHSLVYESIKDYDVYHKAKIKRGYETVPSIIDGWERDDEKKRIDYILSTLHEDVEYYYSVFDGNNEAVISDHYGIEAKISLK